MEEMIIKVDPELLHLQADEIRSKLKNLTGIATDVRGLLDGTASYWNGDAAQTIRNMAKRITTDSEQMAEKVITIASKLEQLAGVYIEVENEVTAEPASLSSDIIK